MADTSAPWQGQLIGDATAAPYSSEEWAHFWALRHGIGSVYNPTYGVIKGTGGGTYEPLFVAATDPVSTNVNLQPGAALVNGRLYENDAAIALTVQANISGNPRIDTVILRVDYVAQTITPVILQGSPAVSPVAPTLQQDTSIWEMALADIAVANGFSTISQSNLTDRRRYSNTTDVGWQPYAWPIQWAHDGADSSGINFTTADNGRTAVVPIEITGNMLLQRLAMWVSNNLGSVTMGWDLYVQDLNDGDSSQNTLRRVAQGQAVITNPGSADLRTIDANPAPVPLTPGIYWLALQRRDAGASIFGIEGRILSSSFKVTAYKIKTTSIPNGQTLDFVAATWTGFDGESLAMRLEGRVFGQTTAYT